MPQKLLEKSRNRFLQQLYPENLIPNKECKGIYKSSKSRRKGIPLQYSQICNQWVLSWNTLKNKYYTRTVNGVNNFSILLYCTVQRMQFIDAADGIQENECKLLSSKCSRKRAQSVGTNISVDMIYNICQEKYVSTGTNISIKFPGKNLVSPNTHILKDSINSAVGGNIVEHLNAHLSIKETSSKKLTPNGVQLMHAPYYVKENNNALSVLHSPDAHHRYKNTAANMVKERLDSKFFHNIYSLTQIANLGKKRDKINIEYKNKLIECKKIALLYGNLSKKTLQQYMRIAKQQGGDLHSNFLSSLERRLDVTLKRVFFFPTLKSARQWIQRGKILVNYVQCTHSSYLLQPADCISICPAAQTSWRKECLQFFTRKGFNAPNLNKNDKNMGSVASRRFPLSPRLMQKFKEWSTLWANSPAYKNKGHKWKQNAGVEEMLFFFSTKSALASYFCKRKIAQRSTLLTVTNTFLTKWLGENRENFSHLLSLRRADWLHHQQALVVDGCFSYRWNKIFAKRKPMTQKTLDWRWSCIKPLHLECSYKHYSVIFLYAPQKLLWPSSINGYLLQKALMP